VLETIQSSLKDADTCVPKRVTSDDYAHVQLRLVPQVGAGTLPMWRSEDGGNGSSVIQVGCGGSPLNEE
jgi:hypothetical protein